MMIDLGIVKWGEPERGRVFREIGGISSEGLRGLGEIFPLLSVMFLCDWIPWATGNGAFPGDFATFPGGNAAFSIVCDS